MTNLAPVFRTAAAAPPRADVPQPQEPPRPAFGIAYFFPGGGTPPADPTPVFDALRALASGHAPADGDGDGRHLRPVDSSRNETPEPPVPSPQVPQEPAPAPEPQPAASAPQDGAQGEKRQPLPRGESERRALAFLAEHPGEDFTPGQIAKAIDARGCRDLMARLAARGVVRRTSDRPLKYQATAQ